jgi:hypothetical protein
MDELKSIIATLFPQTTLPIEPKPTRTAVRRNRKAEARIIDAVLETFDEQELSEAAIENGINYAAILGNGLRGKVAGVVEHFARHGILPELVDYLATERPHVDWYGMLLDTSELK